MPGLFVLARNPDSDSSLGYLLSVPVEGATLMLKARARWPTTARVYCHPLEHWPAEAEVLEEVPVRSCRRRGPAVDLVLDRARENRSQLVFTQPHPAARVGGPGWLLALVARLQVRYPSVPIVFADSQARRGIDLPLPGRRAGPPLAAAGLRRVGRNADASGHGGSAQ